MKPSFSVSSSRPSHLQFQSFERCLFSRPPLNQVGEFAVNRLTVQSPALVTAVPKLSKPSLIRPLSNLPTTLNDSSHTSLPNPRASLLRILLPSFHSRHTDLSFSPRMESSEYLPYAKFAYNARLSCACNYPSPLDLHFYGNH